MNKKKKPLNKGKKKKHKTSEDLQGLVLESGSLDALIERVRFAIPDLLSLNHHSNDIPISVNFRSERHEQVV